MIQVILCETCKNSGRLPVRLEVELPNSLNACKTCNHSSIRTHTYYFCSTGCFGRWITVNDTHNDITLPCVDCRQYEGAPTGFMFGFEQNGVCKTCNGEKMFSIKK